MNYSNKNTVLNGSRNNEVLLNNLIYIKNSVNSKINLIISVPFAKNIFPYENVKNRLSNINLVFEPNKNNYRILLNVNNPGKILANNPKFGNSGRTGIQKYFKHYPVNKKNYLLVIYNEDFDIHDGKTERSKVVGQIPHIENYDLFQTIKNHLTMPLFYNNY